MPSIAIRIDTRESVVAVVETAVYRVRSVVRIGSTRANSGSSRISDCPGHLITVSGRLHGDSVDVTCHWRSTIDFVGLEGSGEESVTVLGTSNIDVAVVPAVSP